MCYNCFVLWCVSRSKALLACVWHEEQLYTDGPVPRNGMGGLADEKPWISMPFSQNSFTMPTCVTFLAFELSTNIPLMLPTSWLLALYVQSVLYIIANYTRVTLQ